MTGFDDKDQADSSGIGSPGRNSTIERLGEQVKLGHQAWLERLRVMQEIETFFAKELLATREPSEALKVCNRWIAKRLELLAADSRDFTGFWMDLVMTAAGDFKVPRAPRRKGEDA